MSATATSRSDSKRMAVIRSFQPIRIERELLAQVFDLAGRGLPPCSTCTGEQPADARQAADRRSDAPVQHGLLGQDTSQQVNEPEAVA